MSFTITILGANSALPAYGRHHTAQFVTVENYHCLIDCGEATQNQIQRFKIKANKINDIFISHLHGDHYLGLMGLIYSMHLSGRTTDLHIFGQRGLDDIILSQLRHSSSVLNFRLEFHELNPSLPEVIIENDLITIASFPLKHRIPCCGFIIREKPKSRRINKSTIPDGLTPDQFVALKKGEDILDEDGKIRYNNASCTLEPKKSRSYAYCSDTKYDEDLLDVIKNVDLLYHEATFLDEKEEWALKTHHATTKQAATIAKKANVKQLIIGHYSARYRNVETFVKESREVFPNTLPAIEGETIEIKE